MVSEAVDLSPSPIAPAEATVRRHRTILPSLPTPFFKVHVHEISHEVPLLGLCAGFESGFWRAKAFAEHLMDYLIEFALTRDEWQNVNATTAHRALRRAARTVYMTDRYHNRGEVGELLLHAVMRQHYGSEPIVSKFYFKSAANDTVKGFDAAHVVFGALPEAFELWLGEAKLYTDVDAAIRDVCRELTTHLSEDYLRSEFMWIENKLPKSMPEIDQVRQLLSEATTLDEVFDVLHVPVLLTYESQTVRDHSKTTDAYVAKFKAEVSKHHQRFIGLNQAKKVKVHLCLIPLKNKNALLNEFDNCLRSFRGSP